MTSKNPNTQVKALERLYEYAVSETSPHGFFLALSLYAEQVLADELSKGLAEEGGG